MTEVFPEQVKLAYENPGHLPQLVFGLFVLGFGSVVDIVQRFREMLLKENSNFRVRSSIKILIDFRVVFSKCRKHG